MAVAYNNLESERRGETGCGGGEIGLGGSGGETGCGGGEIGFGGSDGGGKAGCTESVDTWAVSTPTDCTFRHVEPRRTCRFCWFA